MTEDTAAPPSAPPPAARRPQGRLLKGAAAILVVILLLAAALYLNRRAAAREVLTGWLDRHGVDADVEVERIELDGFVGRIVIGDPADPEFRVERVEVDYAVGMPWSKAGLGVTPSRIRLVRPLARASWRNGRFSMGSLDPLIEEFTGRPPRPDSRAPIVVVEQGRARLETEYGAVQVLADARLEDNKLMRLKARMPAASLKSGGLEGRGLGAEVDLTTAGDRVRLQVKAVAERLSGEGVDLNGTRFTLNGDLPYPDLKARRGDGRARLTAKLQAAQVEGAAMQGRDLTADVDFDGQTRGWIEDFLVTGQADARLTAGRLSGGTQRLAGLTLTADTSALRLAREGDDLRWGVRTTLDARAGALSAGGGRITGLSLSSSGLTLGGRGPTFEAQGPLRLAADRAEAGDLRLRDLTGEVRLDAVQNGPTAITATGALRARAAYDGLGPVGADDVPEIAALKRGLADFRLDAPALRFTTGSAGTTLALTRPLTARPANGGELIVSAGAAPLFAAAEGTAGGGALRLVSRRGGGLPDARIDVTRWTPSPGGFSARMAGDAGLDFGPGRNIRLTTGGALASSGGRLTFVADGCTPVTVERLELGENDVTDLSGRLCPGGGPLIVVADGRWRAEGALQAVAATAPFLAMRFSDAEGPLTVDGGPAGLSLVAGVRAAQVADVTEPQRFLPLQAKGEARLDGEVWTGGFDLTRLGYEVGRIDLKHDGRAEAGGVAITAPGLTFTAAGLQPDDLSPLAADYVKSPVEGSATFQGRFDWTADGEPVSAGVLATPGLDFESPAGKVTGLKGQVVFTSLTPLITAPDQVLTVDRLDTVTPLTDLELRFALDETALNLAGGKIEAAGGRISIEPFSLPLRPGTPWGGVLVVEQIQLNDLLKSANLEDKARLDAVVSGRLPFTYAPDAGYRISGGVLTAVRPGRLSIEPEVFDDLAAGGDPDTAALPPNTMQDLAYQAMQDLAISDLTAEVDSLDGGRLGVRFRINGRHDPSERQQLRLSFMELIRRDFLNKKLNLPSDTPIDLTLDTTWNANQIVSDLLDYARRGETP